MDLLNRKIDSLDLLHNNAQLGNYDGEIYHLALLNIAAGEQFLHAVKHARQEIVLTRMNRAAKIQASVFRHICAGQFARARLLEGGAA